MNAKNIFILSLLILLSFFLISINFIQSTLGPHGGIVKQAGKYNIEMKTNYPNMYTFLLDKNNKPMHNKGILCEIIYFLPNKTQINYQLNYFGAEGFLLESGALNYSSCRIIFNVFGKTLSADFKNENLIVQKK